MSSIPCRKCDEGFYKWANKDYNNNQLLRKMRCNKCDFIDTMREFIDSAKNNNNSEIDSTEVK